jgi:hypothetical protein
MENEMNKKFHYVEIVSTNKTHLVLLVDEQRYRIAWVDCSPKLARANEQERNFIEVSSSGYGLHWPLLDEDLAINPLLEQANPITLEVA